MASSERQIPSDIGNRTGAKLLKNVSLSVAIQDASYYTFYLSITLLKVTKKSAINSHPSKVSTTVIY
jgi:hypothetical protein